MSHTNPQWLPGIKSVPSPNFNQRPVDTEVSLLVIHNISLPAGEFGGPGITQLFTNCLDCSSHADFADLFGLRVSSHLLIDREGLVTQFVPLANRAWHAGESEFCGQNECNDFSIGIELEGTDDYPYTENQYQSLALLTKQICSLYPAITRDRIVGHRDIAPGRKTDPGDVFDWDYYFELL